MTKKEISSIYKEMDEITHILARPGMYVGSTKDETNEVFIYDDDTGKISLTELTYVPAMLKIFDEILSNSCDEYRRNTNMGLNRIDVTIYKEGKIIVRDNGGIPIVIHSKENKCYIPEFVFGRLRTSSNYNDDDNRIVVGTNGVGSALANVFSKTFTIDSADGKKSFHRTWSNNMKTLNDDLEVKKCKDHFTQTTMVPDFSRFDIIYDSFTDDFIRIVEKRCIDAAAANFGLKICFKYYDNKTLVKSSDWKFKKFEEYIELYSDYICMDDCISFKDTEKQCWVYPGDTCINVGFVDGALCSKGTHINAIRLSINKTIQDVLSKKKIDVTYNNISNKYSLFCVLDVVNPSYNSQTKEELTTPVNMFSRAEGYTFKLPDEFLKKAAKSEIVELVLDWYKKKQDADDEKALRKINRESKNKLLRSDKFIDCNSKKADERQLWIYEGDSAASGFRTSRDPSTQAAYLMRGVPLNTDGMSAVRIMQNEVFNDIVKIIGLQWGEYNNKADLKFGKIVIATDMDYDGHKIAGLLLLFFNHFPELFEQNMICRVMSPLIICTKQSGKTTQTAEFYNMNEFESQSSKYKGWTLKYIKGLGGLSKGPNGEYTKMMMSPRFKYFTKDSFADNTLKTWFAKGIAQTRKDMLKENVE